MSNGLEFVRNLPRVDFAKGEQSKIVNVEDISITIYDDYRNVVTDPEQICKSFLFNVDAEGINKFLIFKAVVGNVVLDAREPKVTFRRGDLPTSGKAEIFYWLEEK